LAARTAGYACERHHSFEGGKFIATTLNGKKFAFLVAPERVEQQSFDQLTPADRFEADVVRERSITSWPSVRTDLPNAGANGPANWVGAEVVECSRGPNTLVSSRKPDDLPAFCGRLVAALATDKSSPNSATRMLRRL
jgi:putative intracellular protease/amidase